MTLAQQITYSERRARVSSNVTTVSAANDVTIQFINEGVREFAKVIGGLPKVAYLQLAPKFDVQTNWAIRLTVTGGANALTVRDFVLAATNTASLSAASYAAYLGAQFAGGASTTLSVSVSWDSTAWKFTLYDETAAATYIEVGSPSGIGYVDATDLLFNKIGTQTGSYWTGEIPMDLNLETSLPDDCLSVESVQWDGRALSLAPFDLFMTPQSAGDPSWYAIKGKRIRLAPTPLDQAMCVIQYKSMPTDLATTTDSCPLPSEYHWAPVYYATSLLAAENHDWDAQQQNFGLFLNETMKYKIKEANQNPSMFPRSEAYQPIKVIIP
jgi:hypothetical protein